MRHVGTVSSVALVVVAALQGAANGAGPPRLPGPVAAALREFTDACRDVDGKPDATDAIRRADLNADGIDDYVLDVGGLVCEGAWSVFGDREKAVAVFTGDGRGGAVEAFSGVAYHTKLEGTGRTARLWLGVAGLQCGRKPARDFASESFCDRALVWNAATARFDHAPVSTVRMIE